MPRPSADQPTSPTSSAIAEAALQILRADGPGALSFRRIGAMLGTSHMAIHRRCGSLEGLLDLCAEHLASQLPEDEPALSWAQSTERRFTALYEVMSRNGSLVALQRGRPWLGPEMMRRFSEPALAESLAAGLTLSEMIRTHRGLYMFTTGCALSQGGYDSVGGRAALEDLDPGTTPALAAHAHLIDEAYSGRQVFLDGIRALIAAADPAGRTSG